MNCPEECTILLYLEGEMDAKESQEIQKHLAECPECSRRLEEIQENMAFVLEKLEGPMQELQMTAITGQESVWQSIKKHIVFERKEAKFMKIKKLAVAAVIVIALGISMSMPEVRTVAANLLQVFRVEKVDVLTMTPKDIEKIESAIVEGNNGSLDIDNFGKIEAIGGQKNLELTKEDIAELDFEVKYPSIIGDEDFEACLTEIPIIEITPKVESVNSLISSLGSNYLLPEELDDQVCRIKMGDILYMDYEKFSLAQGPAPQIEVPEGIDVAEVARGFVTLPIWPEDIRRQLEAVNDWEHTLLIPGEEVKKVEVNGHEAVLIKQSQNNSLIWQEDGMLYTINDKSAGEIDIIAVADSMR